MKPVRKMNSSEFIQLSTLGASAWQPLALPRQL